VAFYVGVYPAARRRARGLARRLLDALAERKGDYPQTAVYLDRTQLWGDGWAGPRAAIALQAAGGEQMVAVGGWTDLKYLRHPLELALWVDGQEIGRDRVRQSGDFMLEFSLGSALTAGAHQFEVRSANWYVPHRFLKNSDFRPLAWKPAAATLVELASPQAEADGSVPLRFLSGWHEPETNGAALFRWMNQAGAVMFKTRRPARLALTAEINSLVKPNRLSIRLDGEAVGAWDIDWPEWAFKRVNPLWVEVTPGEHRLELVSAQPAVVQPHDPRPLTVAIGELKLRPE
jgi:hypothetical protein